MLQIKFMTTYCEIVWVKCHRTHLRIIKLWSRYSGFLPSGNKPLFEPILTQVYVTKSVALPQWFNGKMMFNFFLMCLIFYFHFKFNSCVRTKLPLLSLCTTINPISLIYFPPIENTSLSVQHGVIITHHLSLKWSQQHPISHPKSQGMGSYLW